MKQSTDPMSTYPDGQRRTAPPPDLQSSDSKDGYGHVSMFGKAKNKAMKLRDKVKENYKAHYGHGSDDKEEEEEEEETVEDEDHAKSGVDENVEDLTKGMAGLSGLGAADKDDRANQESGNVIKSSLGDIIGKNDDGMSIEETRKDSEVPVDELRHKDSILIDSKENPQEVFSGFEESGQSRGNKGDVFLTTEKEKIGMDVGTPSIPQRAGQAMSGAILGIIGLGKGNKQEEEGDEEKPKSSMFDEPPLGLKDVPKALEEEFQSLLEKSKNPQSDVGEGNELRSNEKPTEEIESGAPVVTKKASGLIQGIRDSLTSGEEKKDDIVPEEQSRENQDNRVQKEGEKNEAQSYAGKLFAAKSVISSKLGYGRLPTEEKTSVEESKGEDELQGPEIVESGAPVVTEKDPGLIQGLNNSFISDGDNKDDIVVLEEHNRENQDEGQKSGEEEEKEGQKSDNIASKLGFGKLPSKEEAVVEESKGEERADFEEAKAEDKLPAPKAEEGTKNKETFKSTIVSKLSPGEDDKALSEKITEAFNNSAKSILGGFYGGSPKEAAPPSPSPVNNATAELPQNNNPQNTSSPKGIMGRVTGVVSSFIGKKPKDVADNSPHTQEPTFGEHKEDPIGSSESQTVSQIEGETK